MSILNTGSMMIKSYLNRVVPSDGLNADSNAELEPAKKALLPPKKPLQGEVVDGEIVFQENARLKSAEVGKAEVDVQVYHFSIEGTGIHAATGTRQLIAGKALKVGDALDSSLLGQTLLAYASKVLSTVVRLPANECVSSISDDATRLVATLPALCKAVNAIPCSRFDCKSHIVLITPSLSVSEAYSKLSRVLDLRLTIIAPAEQERGLIKKGWLSGDSIVSASDMKAVRSLISWDGTNQPPTVIAHDFSPLSQEIWRSMPSMGRFVVNEAAISDAPETLPFTRGTSFTSTNLATLYKYDPSGLENISNKH